MRNSPQHRHDKLIDERLRVHAWTPTGFLTAGLLSLEEDGDSMSASFEYNDAYLTSPGAYPLDPLNLPLGKSTFTSQSQYERVGAIFDAAPDAWGRKVVSAQLPEDIRGRVFRGAFLRGADGIGALLMTPSALADQIDLNAIVQLSLDERPTLSQVHRAAAAAREFDAGEDLTDEMKSMLGGSWTIGGARPKAILRDDRPRAHAGASVIAKFDSKHDKISRNRIEFASLSMAQAMGFEVPGHQLVELGDGKTALVLARFDRNAIHNERESMLYRRHYVSAMSLASHQAQSKFLNSRMDQAVLSWSKLLEIASRIGARPAAAKAEMFGRLCLNAALQNTDDHLKNFGFLKSTDSPLHYEIAPVFDVSPQAAQRHYLHCLDLGQVYTLQEVIAKARNLGIAAAVATEVEQRIVDTLAESTRYFDSAGLSLNEASQVQEWIHAGLGQKYLQGEVARQRG